jgi:3-deoxy-manno-octulosonate cytidylyltransferase (CMP-KDO synthetase)
MHVMPFTASGETGNRSFGQRALFLAPPIPASRNAGKQSFFVSSAPRHLRFRRATLLQFVQWKPTPLERCESLEQLRALENG